MALDQFLDLQFAAEDKFKDKLESTHSSPLVETQIVVNEKEQNPKRKAWVQAFLERLKLPAARHNGMYFIGSH